MHRYSIPVVYVVFFNFHCVDVVFCEGDEAVSCLKRIIYIIEGKLNVYDDDC